MYMYMYIYMGKNAPAMSFLHSFCYCMVVQIGYGIDLCFVIGSMVLFFNHTLILKVFEYFYVSDTIWSQS